MNKKSNVLEKLVCIAHCNYLLIFLKKVTELYSHGINPFRTG